MNKRNFKRVSNVQRPKLQQFTVEEGCGLLAFLRQRLSSKPAGTVKSYLTHGQVSVNGVVQTQYNYPVMPGQNVTISLTKKAPLLQDKRLEILFENDEILVVNKQAGLLCVSTESEKEQTAFHILMEYVRRIHPSNRIFIVHRLDRDTSGVVLFAKNEEIKKALQDNWDTLVSFRGYYALVEGRLTEKRGKIVSWLKETDTHLVYSSKKHGEGKEAITNYRVIKENEQFSLLDIWLGTGRKNQIRVHMKDLGHPVIGDKKYGSTGNPLKRLGLHAYKLELVHPFTNEKLVFEAKAPLSFMNFVKNKG